MVTKCPYKSQNHKKRIVLITLSAIAMAGGICIYIFFRKTELAFFWLFNFPRPQAPIRVPKAIVYHGADVLWFLSGVWLIRAIWINKLLLSLIYIWVLCGAGIILELLQLYRVIPGTFDVLEIVFYAGISLGWTVFLLLQRNNVRLCRAKKLKETENNDN